MTDEERVTEAFRKRVGYHPTVEEAKAHLDQMRSLGFIVGYDAESVRIEDDTLFVTLELRRPVLHVDLSIMPYVQS